mmetsp:Transcript_5973/g.7268  ORF Transcript_5973/g.7268 Transcript_5973/m.7268 type:complete len:1243 (-) Transcript_5973:294-4022(-)
MLKDLTKKLTKRLKNDNTVNVNQVKLEKKVENKEIKQYDEDEDIYDNVLKEYESKAESTEILDKRKCIMEIHGSIKRLEKLLENSCDVNFVENSKLEKEPKEKSEVRDKGESKLQESLFIIPVKIGSKKSRALIDTGAQCNFITPELVEKSKVSTELAPEVVLTTATGEAIKANKKVKLNLGIGTKLVDVQMYVAAFKHPIILGRPFTKQYNKEIDIVEEKVFGISNCAEEPLIEKELQTQKIEYIDSHQFLRDIRPKEADIGMFYIMEETLDNGKEVPEFVKSEFSDVVTNESPQRLPEFKSVTHRIHLIPGAKPTARPPYRMSQYETEELKKQIEELLQHGFIQKSSSPFAAPVLFVKKKDKALRLCVDFRLLNLNTIKNAFPLPVIEDLFMKIGNAKIFSKLDLMSGYFQIRMDPKDEEKTAFVTPFGHYHWKVMPFGVVNGPATFQSFMNQILGDTPNVLVYLDDILIYSHTKEEHYKDVQKVLQILRNNNLIAKKKKCEFFKNKLDFLGHTITPNGIVPNDAKIKAIIDWQKPQNAKEAMRFMGLCNYYRKFVQGFSKISSPINEFMAEHCEWGETQDEAFKILKEKLTTSPILVLPNFNKEFRLTTDASDTAIGATLEQVDENNKLVGVIGYFSKKLIGAQLNYFVMEKEFLAIIESLKHFRSILYGRRFVLRSDHLSLTYIMTQGKVPQNRIARWLDFLSEYDFEIQHLSGNKNNAADALSRIGINNIEVRFTAIPHDYDFSEDYETDINFKVIYDCLKNNKQPPKEISNHIRHFMLEGNQLYYSVNVGMDQTLDRLCVPKGEIRNTLILKHHNPPEEGHFGTYKTYYALADAFYWPKMFKDVIRFVNSCLTCQQSKSLTQRTQNLLQPLPIPEDRWTSVSMDFITGLPPTTQGCDSIMVIVDRFTKVAHFVPTIKGITGEQAAKLFIDNVIRLHGLPQEIISDKDLTFLSSFWKTIQSSFGTELKFSTTNHPETDGQTERVNAIVNRLLRSYAANEHVAWQDYISTLEFAYNSSHQTSIQTTPFMADLGRLPRIPNAEEIIDQLYSSKAHELAIKLKAIYTRTQDLIMEAQAEQEKHANKKREAIKYEIGDFILLHRDAYLNHTQYFKLQPVYFGPYRIVGQSGENAFEVDIPVTSKKHRIINSKWFRKFNERSHTYTKKPPLTEYEAIQRAQNKEIIGIAGYHKLTQTFDVYWLDCHPGHSSSLRKDMFFRHVPEIQRKSLLANLRLLYPNLV